jgi:hypothetical protein
MGLVVRILQTSDKKERFVDEGFGFSVSPQAERHGGAVGCGCRSRVSSLLSDGGAFLIGLKRVFIPVLRSEKVPESVEDPRGKIGISEAVCDLETLIEILACSLRFSQTEKYISHKAQGFSDLSLVIALPRKKEGFLNGFKNVMVLS